MQFELVTPAKSLASFEAKMVVVPGSEGGFGVLDGHQPLLSTLKAGVVRVEKPNGDEVAYQVGKGFVDVNQTKVTILAEKAEAVIA